MIFATTLIGRPLGALIFGHFADTLGRKRTTVVAVGGFGVVTLLIALLPGYERWGSAVIFIFIALRLIDGIFLGGEYTSANPLAMEHCPKPKRGFYGAVIQSAASVGTAAISLVTLAVLLVLPAGDLTSPYVQWGWRIPFLVGAVMAFALAYYYHYAVEESDVWKKSRQDAAHRITHQDPVQGREPAQLPAGVCGHDGLLAVAERLIGRHARVACHARWG